ncbi:MAG TPA: transcriptional repressor [Myxococcales bacterium]|nr:transcriptional repressor [Myxococcales bacterium]HIK84944.1 transcriptional repressor [Myxococcales bacterium]
MPIPQLARFERFFSCSAAVFKIRNSSYFILRVGDPALYARSVNPTPPEDSALPRRNRSRQRDQILDWVRATDTHPTANEIYQGLEPVLAGLSLGTVYRNLEVLVEDGDLEEVKVSSGATRYDGNLSRHHHFACERCGRILDIEIPEPRGLKQKLVRDYGHQPARVSISISGICLECADPES